MKDSNSGMRSSKDLRGHTIVDASTLAHRLTATGAYYLWQRAGCPEGRDWEFWFAAEVRVRETWGEYFHLWENHHGAAAAVRESKRRKALERADGIISEALS